MRTENTTANRFVLDPRSTSDLRLKARQDPEASLKQTAEQFEGLLLQMMLKSMRDATPQDGLMNSDQTRFFTSILDQQLAQNLSAGGKLGFAKAIEENLRRSMNIPSADGGAADSSLGLLQQTLLQRGAASSAVSFAGGAERIRGLPSEAPFGATAVGSAAGASAEGREFVNRIWPHAVGAANTLGVPPHFLVAHSALESGWGKSEIRAADGSSTYNIFGIKAGRSWRGASVEVQTTEYIDGVAQSVKEKFRAYGSYAEAFQDYANLLRNNPRFSDVLGHRDGGRFAKSLQESGYATDPQYADKLHRIINGATLRQALVS